MRSSLKLTIAAAALSLAASPAWASLVSYSTFCESAGNPAVVGGTHAGRCDAGETSVGNDIGGVNIGSIGLGQGLIMQGYGDNLDNDSWTFTATHSWKGFMDLFAYAGIGTNTGLLAATLSDGTNVWNLSSLIAGAMFGSYAAGTYTLTVLGANATDVYNYDLRVEAVPVPAAALLFGTALAGFAAARRRRKVEAV